MTNCTRFVAAIIAFSFACSRADAERLVLVSASYGKNIVALCDADGKVLWSHKTTGPRTGHAGHHDLQFLDDGNILFHDDWTTIVEMTLDKKVVWTYDASKQNGNQGKRVEVHAFQRLPNGLTMIAESGVGRIIEVDKAGKIHAEIALKPGGTQHTRMARKLVNGNYLVCAENPGVVTEYDARGAVVWEYPIKTRVYGAIRLRNGNTLIASGGGASVVEVTRAGQVVWEIKDTLPDARIALKWTTSLTELDNGNFVVGNCHAGDNNPQIFEITRDRKVVWQFNQYETFGNGLACSQVLTERQSAFVRKLLVVQASAAGEQYGTQRTNIDIGKHKGFILQPAKLPADGTRPWVWYAPTIGSHPNQSNEWVLRKLLDRGFHVCGVNVGESYGSPAGRQAYTAFHQHLVREYKLAARASLLAQSRGGLMLYNWAAENPDKVRCIAGIYPVCDLRSYPGLSNAAGAYALTPQELEKQLTRHNPIDRLEPLAKAGVPILHVHGDADAVVPLEKNSQVVADRYAALGGKMKLIVVAGKGHAEIPEYFQEPRLVQFLSDGGFTEESSRRPGSDAAPEVTGINVAHRHGQTFVTWTDAATGADGARYRYSIYRSERPITANNLKDAELCMHGVLSNSARLFGTAFTMKDRLDATKPYSAIEEGGKPLPPWSGLGVHTVRKDARAYYAVLATDEKLNPISRIFPGRNATALATEEKVAPVQPIKLYDSKSRGVYSPQTSITGQKGLPLRVELHASQGQGGGAGDYGDYYLHFATPQMGYHDGLPGVFSVEERREKAGNYLLLRVREAIEHPSGTRAMETYWFGYYCVPQLASHPEPRAYPFTERRQEWIIDWVIGKYAADPERITASGGSMGAWGSTTYALRHSERFAAVYPNRPRTRQRGLPSLAGMPAKGKAVLMDDGVTDYFTRMDMVTFAAEHAGDLPFFGWCCGRRDGFATWQEQVDMVKALTAARHGFAFAWNDGDHSSGSQPMARIVKHYPPEKFARNRSYPAFSNSSLDQKLGNGDPKDGDLEGGINLGFVWKDVVDEKGRWEVTLSNDLATDVMTVDVTPRRCQQFKARAGTEVSWTTSLGAAGKAVASSDGVVTIPRVQLRPNAETRLTIKR